MSSGGHSLTEAWNLQLQGRIDTLEKLLLEAAAQFEFYEQQHLAKRPPDHEKAKTSREWAARIHKAISKDFRHNWVRSTLGHGEAMCSKCKLTNREAAVLGLINECTQRG